MAPRTLLPAAVNVISFSGTRSTILTLAAKVAVIGPMLCVNRTSMSSGVTTVSCSTPGTHCATASGCSKNVQTELTGSATSNCSRNFMAVLLQWTCRGHGRSVGGGSPGPRFAELGQHPAHIDRDEVLSVLGRGAHIRRGVDDL